MELLDLLPPESIESYTASDESPRWDKSYGPVLRAGRMKYKLQTRDILRAEDVVRDWPRGFVSTRSGPGQLQIDSLRDCVEDSFALPDPLESVRGLEGMLRRFDDLFEFGRARFRRAVNRVEPIALADSPAWLTRALEQERDAHGDFPALHSAEYAVRALLQRVDAKGELTSTGPNSVEVSWDCQCRLKWRIASPRVRWPGVDVRTYWQARDGQMQARSFFFAPSVVEHALERFSADGC